MDYKPIERPSLFVVAEKQLTHQETLSVGLTLEQCDNLLARGSKKVFDQLKNSSFYVTVKDADHATFVDSKLIKSPLSDNEFNPRGIEVTRALLVDFFDHHLKNKKSTVLKEQNNQFSDIIIMQK